MRWLRGDRSAAGLVVLGGLAAQGMLAVTGVVSARLLGVQGRGDLALVIAFSALASQATFGGSLPNAIAYHLAQRRVGSRDGLRVLAHRWILPSFVPGLAAAAVLLAVERTDWALGVAVALITVETIWYRLLAGALQGEGNAGRMMAAGLAPQSIYLIAVVVALGAGLTWNAPDVLLVYIVATLVGLLLGRLMLQRPTGRRHDKLDGAEVWRTTRQTFISSVGPVDGLQLDRSILGGIMGSVQLGLYSAAAALGNLSSIIGASIALLVLPRVSAAPNRAAQMAIARKWVPAGAATIAVIVVVLELTAGWIIRTAFGAEFAGAIPCARGLVLADGILGFRRILIAVLQGQGRGRTASLIELAALPLVVAGLVVACSVGNLVDVAIALASVGVVVCVALGVCVARGGRARPASELLPTGSEVLPQMGS